MTSQMDKRISHYVYNTLAFFIALVIASIIYLVWLPMFAHIEASIFPVVTDFKVVETKQHDTHLDIYVSFTKSRDCEFLGINWYSGKERVSLIFEEDRGEVPLSRPTGEQLTGPWDCLCKL